MKTFYLRFIGLFSVFLVILPALAFLPGTASAAAGTFKTDNFNACTMNSSLWTFTNPLNDGTTSVNGTTVSISVPQGTDHDIWKGGTSPSINAPRFMQPATDTDFNLQVKMNSGFLAGARYQTQGILIQQDATRVLRFEFYGDGVNTFVFAGKFSGGTGSTIVRQSIGAVGISPLYMRVQRAGNAWTQSYSLDGTAWTALPAFNFTMAVASVGFYGGNTILNPTDVAPAHTAVFDYFYNMDDGTIPGDTTVPNILTVNPTGTGTVDVNPKKTNYDCGEKVTLTALPGAGWQFTNWSGGLIGTSNPANVTMNGSTTVGAVFNLEGTGNPPKLLYLPIVTH
jgi:hypothetical protein